MIDNPVPSCGKCLNYENGVCKRTGHATCAEYIKSHCYLARTLENQHIIEYNIWVRFVAGNVKEVPRVADRLQSELRAVLDRFGAQTLNMGWHDRTDDKTESNR